MITHTERRSVSSRKEGERKRSLTNRTRSVRGNINLNRQKNSGRTGTIKQKESTTEHPIPYNQSGPFTPKSTRLTVILNGEQCHFKRKQAPARTEQCELMRKHCTTIWQPELQSALSARRKQVQRNGRKMRRDTTDGLKTTI